MANTKEIKRRIKSVKNTKQITRAMELVSAVKMKRAQDKALTSRRYADYGWEMLLDVALKVEDGGHYFLSAPKGAAQALVVVISSDRGLCGGFNVNVFRAVEELTKREAALAPTFVAVGKKAQDHLRRRKRAIVAAFPGFASAPHIVEVRPITKIIAEEWKKGEYAAVYLAVNGFVSTTVQKPLIKKLLPFAMDDVGTAFERGRTAKVSGLSFEFEPSPAAVVGPLIERLMETQVYQAVLESGASEHSARMIAMHSATQNSNDLMKDLQFSFNRSRQESITREIAEISSAAESMK
jgi:F-type H+-transporting ATPase subunit gamma